MQPIAHVSSPQFSGIYRFRAWRQVEPLLFESGHVTGRWKDSALQAVRAALKKAGLDSEMLQPFGWLHPKGYKEFIFATNDRYGHHADEWKTLFHTNAIQLNKHQQHWGHNPDGWLELPKPKATLEGLAVSSVNRVKHWVKALWLRVFPPK